MSEKITCPNPNCCREDVEVSDEGVVAKHYFSATKSLTPKEPCRVSNTVLAEFDQIPASELFDRITWRPIQPSMVVDRGHH